MKRKQLPMAVKVKQPGYIRKTIQLMGRGYTLRHSLKIARYKETGHGHKARG